MQWAGKWQDSNNYSKSKRTHPIFHFMFFLKRNMSLTISQTLKTLFIWVTLPSNVSRWLAYAFIWISYWLLTQSKLSHWLNKSDLFHVASFYLTLPNICICSALLLVNWLGSIPTIGWTSSTLGHVANWCLTLTHICACIQPRMIKRIKIQPSLFKMHQLLSRKHATASHSYWK